MHTRVIILRTSCNARNAYSSASALCGTFISPVHRHGIESGPATSAMITVRRIRQPLLHRVRCITTSTCLKQAIGSQAASVAPVNDGQNEDTESRQDIAVPTPKVFADVTSPVPRKELNKRRTLEEAAQAYYAFKSEWPDATGWQGRMKELATNAGLIAKRGLVPTPDVLDYQGKAIPVRRAQTPPQNSPPWALSQDEVADQSAREVLAEEIARFLRYWEITPSERLARDQAIADVQRVLHRLKPAKAFVALSGSEKTGLAMTTSDIDIRFVKPEDLQKDAFDEVLELARAKMTGDKRFACVVLRNAKFSIINAQHIATGIDIQIVVGPSTGPQQWVTRELLRSIPNMKDLYMLLHTTLSMRGLLDVFNGGVGSYGLFVMIAASLRSSTEPSSGTIVDQLLHFLNFYATFDTEKHGISLLPQGSTRRTHVVGEGRSYTFEKHNAKDGASTKAMVAATLDNGDHVTAGQIAMGQTRPFQPYLLCLQDPARPMNDLGRKSNAIKHVQATFKALRDELQLNLVRGAYAYAREPHSTLLEPLIGRCDVVYAERRRKMEDFGQHVAELNRQRASENSENGKQNLEANPEVQIEEIVDSAEAESSDQSPEKTKE